MRESEKREEKKSRFRARVHPPQVAHLEKNSGQRAKPRGASRARLHLLLELRGHHRRLLGRIGAEGLVDRITVLYGRADEPGGDERLCGETQMSVRERGEVRRGEGTEGSVQDFT